MNHVNENEAAILLSLALLLSAAYARPSTPLEGFIKREVPQEHSHNQFIATVNTNLKTNNPGNIVDAIFGLLGNAAASQGQGDITDTGMTAALIYRALERNTGKVGLASMACTSIKAVNPEIAAIQQHQDPVSSRAAATNKAIVLELAKQIASVGGDPQDALKSGTFAPGNPDDNTGAGNTCDVQDDTEGCIFTQNLLVEDASADEINAAVAGIAAATLAAPLTPA